MKTEAEREVIEAGIDNLLEEIAGCEWRIQRYYAAIENLRTRLEEAEEGGEV